jgi:hypothetical protein
MNAGAPTCPHCGGLNTNPQSAQCRFCFQLLPQPGGVVQPYGQPQAYGQPQNYGAPPMGGYGAPQPQAPNPYAPNPYGGPQPNPYAQQYPVQGFGGVQPFHGGNGYINRGGNGWSTFFWIRLGIALIVVFFSLMGACVQALSH